MSFLIQFDFGLTTLQNTIDASFVLVFKGGNCADELFPCTVYLINITGSCFSLLFDKNARAPR